MFHFPVRYVQSSEVIFSQVVEFLTDFVSHIITTYKTRDGKIYLRQKGTIFHFMLSRSWAYVKSIFSMGLVEKVLQSASLFTSIGFILGSFFPKMRLIGRETLEVA